MNQHFKKPAFLINVLLAIAAFLISFGFINYYVDQDQGKPATKQLKFNTEIWKLKLVPDTSLSLAHFVKQQLPSNKIILIVDAGCSTCINTLSKWNDLIKDKHLDSEKIIIFGYDSTFAKLKFIASQMSNMKSAFVLDPDYRFGSLNEITQDSNNKILLVDKDYNVIAVGNPFLNIDLLDIYIKTLSE